MGGQLASAHCSNRKHYQRQYAGSCESLGCRFSVSGEIVSAGERGGGDSISNQLYQEGYGDEGHAYVRSPIYVQRVLALIMAEL
jgi:hypothetical protein